METSAQEKIRASEKKPSDIKRGQLLRVKLRDQISDVTGFVLSVDEETVKMKLITP